MRIRRQSGLVLYYNNPNQRDALCESILSKANSRPYRKIKRSLKNLLQPVFLL